MKQYTLIFFILGGIIACGAPKAAVAPAKGPVTEADIAAMDRYPGYTLAQYNEGKAHFEKHCGQCHGLKNPAKYTPEQWDKIMPRMADKVSKKEGTRMEPEKEDLIKKYVVTTWAVNR